MPVTSGTVTSGTPAETWIVTVLPKATGPSAGAGVDGHDLALVDRGAASVVALLDDEAERLEVGRRLLGRLPGDVGDGDRLVALADDDRDDLVALEVGAGGRVEADHRAGRRRRCRTLGRS